MRVLVVSAHYPPNFVSGGTLAPQRIAHGLRKSGHEVSVYAGWLGEREPLEAWNEVDGEGMAVRWIVTTPWTAWSNRRNFDNPQVSTDFRAHLADITPDVVHVHSLQTLGVGIVRECVMAGVPVVVTMHDFWWICARQFLCDPALRPCSLVVSCGMCHCDVDRAWLDARNAELRQALAGVSQILAVSESSAAVLRANGFGLDDAGPELIVDENGMPPLPAPSSRPRLTSRPIVFLYTGGSDVLKGVRSLVDALDHLADLDGWSVHAYGVGPYLAEHDISPPQAMVSLPAFSPAQMESVYAAADVLVVPSIVRESYSLVTREALSRGLPVICTDTLGPEEVVKDGQNGVVVPAGDAKGLARAMRAVVEDHDLRERISRGASQPIGIRLLADQITATSERLRALVADPISPPCRRRRRVDRVLILAGIQGAPLRYRAQFAAEALGLVGRQAWVRHYRSPDAVALATMSDALVVYRVPATDQVLALIDAVRARGIPVFYDVDDLIFDAEVAEHLPTVAALPSDERDLYLQGVRRYRTTLEACDAFIGSTSALVQHAGKVAGLPAYRWQNGVGVGPARCSDAALANPRSPGPLRVGYLSGTKTHDEDWRYVEPAISEVLRLRPTVELWLGGLVTPTAALRPFAGRVRRIPMKPWWELPWVLRDLDVNLAPLAPGGQFNEAKSAIKWLEAALAETPTVASPTLPFREAIDPGRTGELAATADDFARAILGLLDEGARRTRMGKLARRAALMEWSPHLQGQRYLDILEDVAVGRVVPSRWTDATALDEPWADTALEDYTPPDPMLLAPIVPTRRDADEVGPTERAKPRRSVGALRHAVDAIVRQVGQRT